MKKMRLFFGMFVLVVLLIVPSVKTAATSGDCTFFSDTYIDENNVAHYVCPAWSGSGTCTAPCNTTPTYK